MHVFFGCFWVVLDGVVCYESWNVQGQGFASFLRFTFPVKIDEDRWRWKDEQQQAIRHDKRKHLISAAVEQRLGRSRTLMRVSTGRFCWLDFQPRFGIHYELLGCCIDRINIHKHTYFFFLVSSVEKKEVQPHHRGAGQHSSPAVDECYSAWYGWSNFWRTWSKFLASMIVGGSLWYFIVLPKGLGTYKCKVN